MKGLVIKGIAIGLAALVAASVMAAGPASAYPTLGVCQYDAKANLNSCSYSNPDGIKSVFISLATDDGIVVVVNETYDCESPVFVQWENLGPTHHYEVEACPPDPAVPDPEPLPVGTLPEPPEPPRGFGDLKLPTGRPWEAQQELLILITPRVLD
jgi:hypothetical protein